MKELNRDNYGMWLADWLEGTLDESRTEQLISFLNENPDIMEEARLLSTTRLTPPEVVFGDKDVVRKSPADLSAAQVEFLSAAFHENDLSDEQSGELMQNLAHNRENKIIFDLTAKAKLVPPDIKYPDRKSLKKITPAQKMFRLAAEALSIAATIAVLILINIMTPDSLEKKNDPRVSAVSADLTSSRELIIYTQSPILTPVLSEAVTIIAAHSESVSGIRSGQQFAGSEIHHKDSIPSLSEHPSQSPETPAEIIPVMFSSFSPQIEFEQPRSWLVASSLSFTVPAFDDDRSRVRKFFAATFRDKILKEESYSDMPLSRFDYALAGIEGINRLLDWNMELRQTTGDEGEVKSVFFSSMLLTFNAPVRKTDE